jgi:hypothetical protein
MKLKKVFVIAMSCIWIAGCSHSKIEEVREEDAARINRKLVKQTVVYEPGAEDGAVVPDLSAPQLRAMMIPEHIENGRLVEKHREWQLEGEVTLLGTPAPIKRGK